jgi:hypothetical protein
MTIVPIGHTSNATDNASSMSLAVPAAAQAGDLLLFHGACDGAGFSAPTGFAVLHDLQSGGSHGGILAWRTIAAGDPGSYIVQTKNGNERGIGTFAVYRGQDPSAPIDVSSANSGNGTSLPLAPVTPGVDGAMVVAFAGFERGNNGAPVFATWPAAMTERMDNANGPPGTGAGSASAGFADVLQTSAQAVSGSVTVSVGASNWTVIAVAIRPVQTVAEPFQGNLTTPLLELSARPVTTRRGSSGGGAPLWPFRGLLPGTGRMLH